MMGCDMNIELEVMKHVLFKRHLLARPHITLQKNISRIDIDYYSGFSEYIDIELLFENTYQCIGIHRKANEKLFDFLSQNFDTIKLDLVKINEYRELLFEMGEM